MNRIHAAIISAIIATSLASCSESVIDPKKLVDTPTLNLCEMYYFASHPSTYTTGTVWPGKQAAIKTELNRRNALTQEDWSAIDAGRPQAGISECALRAVWGNPLNVYHKVTEAGDLTQYVYGLSRTVNLTNGQVKSIKY